MFDVNDLSYLSIHVFADNMYTTVTADELKIELQDVVTVQNNTLDVSRENNKFKITFNDKLGLSYLIHSF